MMQFDFECRTALPRLAWGAVLEKGRGNVTVYHGEQVEIREDGFFEGAWNGPVVAASALTATVVCGSGGACDQGSARFWAGSDNIFPIHSIRRTGTLFVSNSPIFAQVLAGEAPDRSYPFYYDDFIRIARRGYSVDGKLRTAEGNRVRLNFGHIMTVDRKMRVSFHRHPECAPFSDYHSYYRLLAGSVKQVLDNAASAERRFPYDPLAACSRGYDTNACAVLAARAGCEEAMTFVRSAKGGGADNGEEIARALNLRCTVGNRDLLGQTADLSEFCIVPHSMGAPYFVLEDLLAHRILVSGHGGDTVWGMAKSRVFDDNRASWLRFQGGYGLCEYRLRIGMLMLPPARIASTRNREIHRIMHSDEMRPWRLGGGYDRPIPRRILEEAGVDRRAFGMNKQASSQIRFDNRNIQSGHTGQRYRKFMEDRSRRAGFAEDSYWKFRYRWRRFVLSRFASRKSRAVEYTRVRQMFSFLGTPPVQYEWYYLFCFRFSFEELKDRYQTCLRADARSSGPARPQE